MVAHQAPPSLVFSRQEHWSGFPFPSPDRGPISRLYGELSKCNSKKQTIQFKNGKKTRTVISEDIQVANKHMKGCSTLLTIKEKQIRTTVRASGWVEGCALISYKSSKITTSCWITTDRRIMEPIQKKKIPHVQRHRRSHSKTAGGAQSR